MTINEATFWKINLSEELKITIREGVYFMLYIHNMIAERIVIFNSSDKSVSQTKKQKKHLQKSAINCNNWKS